jgi:hypothetical protein
MLVRVGVTRPAEFPSLGDVPSERQHPCGQRRRHDQDDGRNDKPADPPTCPIFGLRFHDRSG